MKLIDRFFCSLMNLFLMLSKCLLIAMTLIICMGVFYRRVLNTGLSWTDEVAMLFMVWCGFISMAYGVQQKLHISVEVFYNLMPKGVRFILKKIINALVFAIGVLLLFYGVKLMESTMSNVMTATRWPTSVRYAPVAISGLLMAYFSFAELIGFKSVGTKNEVKEVEEGE